MAKKRILSMGLSAEDLAFVAEGDRQTFTDGIVEDLYVEVLGAGTVDPMTDVFTPTAPTWVKISGTLSVLSEDDVLVGMEGKVEAGDLVAKFYGPDVITYIDTLRIRQGAAGSIYNVAGRLPTGLGPIPHRVEFALKRDASQEA